MPGLSGAGVSETWVSSSPRTASGNSGRLPGSFGGANKLRVQLDVTAASGVDPTLTVVVEDSLDGTNYNTVGSFAQKITTGREVIDITTLFAELLRVRWTITGTIPSFTFSVMGYCEG